MASARPGRAPLRLIDQNDRLTPNTLRIPNVTRARRVPKVPSIWHLPIMLQAPPLPRTLNFARIRRLPRTRRVPSARRCLIMFASSSRRCCTHGRFSRPPPGTCIQARVRLSARTGRRPGTGARSSTDGRSGTGRRPASDGASPASTLASPNGQAVTASLPLAVAWGAPQRPRAGRLTLSRRRPRLISQRTAATPSGRRQVVWMVALTVLVLLTAAGTMAALMRQPSTGRGDRAGNQGNVPGGQGAAAARAAAARWVSREVSRSDIIGCDAVMCTALVDAGVPSSDLLVLRPTAPDPLGADVLVATPVLQSQFGRRLRTEYAPAVLASFGKGSSAVAVRLV